MSELLTSLQTALAAMWGWELIAVVFAIAYLLLALKENILCWYAALISTTIYTVLFWNVSLLMESLLQVYYVAMAIYGWYQWRQPVSSGLEEAALEQGAQNNTNSALKISCWGLQRHLQMIGAIVLISLISGFLLNRHTDAAWPYLDSFTTWASVFTTYMVAKKVLENWLYWVVIDALSIFLYLDRGLYLTAILFVGYTVIAVIGFYQWRQSFQQDNRSLANA